MYNVHTRLGMLGIETLKGQLRQPAPIIQELREAAKKKFLH